MRNSLKLIAGTKLAIAIICALAVISVSAEGVKQKIRFARGASSTTVKGAVVRGDQDRYYVGAQKGQTMSLRISSLESNAVFQVYSPGEAQTLPGAGEGDDATNWSGELPEDGEYVIVVGGTRGNATYNLRVSIQ